MFRQARELLALPLGNSNKNNNNNNKDKTKGAEGAKSPADKQPDGKSRGKKGDKKRDISRKVSKQSGDNDDSKLARGGVAQPPKQADKSSQGALEDPLRRSAHKRQNNSSSSGGSSSGYLSQANGFHTATTTTTTTTTDEVDDNAPLGAPMTQNGLTSRQNELYHLQQQQQQQWRQHQSQRSLSNGMIDTRSLNDHHHHHHWQAQRRAQHFQSQRAPTMVPMMIDDDDDEDDDDAEGDQVDGGDELVAQEHEVELDFDHPNGGVPESDDLDVRQMLASHRDRRSLVVAESNRLGEPLAAEQRARSHHLQHSSRHFGGGGGHRLIDGLPRPSLAADDKLIRPTYLQTRHNLLSSQSMGVSQRAAMAGHHANSDGADEEENDDDNDNDDDVDVDQVPPHSFDHRHETTSFHSQVGTFVRPAGRQFHLEQPTTTSTYLYDGHVTHQPKSLDNYHHHHQQQHDHQQLQQQQHRYHLTQAVRQQYLSKFLHPHDRQLIDNTAAAVYYQPNIVDSGHQRHRYREQQHDHQQQHHHNLLFSEQKLYERPRYLQSTNSFLYHQPASYLAGTHQRQQFATSRRLSAAHKPVPPLPTPPQVPQAHSQQDYEVTNAHQHQHQQQQQLANGAHLRTQSRLGAQATMQTSGSRQHLTSSADHQHHHQHSSSASSSPHARRNQQNHNNNNNNISKSLAGSSQLSVAKQNLRSVPNRSTPTPTHLMHHNHHQNGPAGNHQMLPVAQAGVDELAAPMSCCGKFAKFLLFVANALFWSAGIALGAWGILALVDDHKYNLSQLLVFEPSTRMSLFQLLSWSFITLGCATILVGFCGCSAMFKNSRWILGLYIFLILAVFALDLATGLLAVIFQERLVANVRLRLVNKLRAEYGIQASFTAAMDYIQTRYECCGLDGHFDYDQSLWRLQRLGGFEATVARTCCHLRNTFDDQAHVNPRPVNESMCQSTDVRFHQSYRYRRGCLDDLERLIRHKIWTFTIGCGAVGAVILLSLVFATCFCRSIPSRRGSRKSSAATATGQRVGRHQQLQTAAYLEAATNPKKTKHSNYR